MSLIFVVALLTIGWLFYHLYLKNLLAQGQAGKFKIFLIALGLIFLILAATGRAPALFAVIGAAMTQVIRLAPYLVRYAPFLKRYLGAGMAAGSAGSASASGVSQVRTRTIVMSLDHASGGMSGTVQSGEFAGRTLASLSVIELQQLHEFCRVDDTDALRLLENYIARERAGEWNASSAGSAGDRTDTGRNTRNEQPMNETEARQVLGLQGQLTREIIVNAHRSLMGRFHPDKGGNDYLATKINTARRVLLDTLGK